MALALDDDITNPGQTQPELTQHQLHQYVIEVCLHIEVLDNEIEKVIDRIKVFNAVLANDVTALPVMTVLQTQEDVAQNVHALMEMDPVSRLRFVQSELRSERLDVWGNLKAKRKLLLQFKDAVDRYPDEMRRTQYRVLEALAAKYLAQVPYAYTQEGLRLSGVLAYTL